MSAGGECLIYVVHLSQDATGFCAIVRQVSCEQSVAFTDAGALARFFAAAALDANTETKDELRWTR